MYDSTSEIAGVLVPFCRENDGVYLRLDPPLRDFRQYDGNLHLHGSTQDVYLSLAPVNGEAQDLGRVWSLLCRAFTDAGMLVLAHDLKPLFTRLRHLGSRAAVPPRFFDLAYLARFAGERLPPPAGFSDAKKAYGGLCTESALRMHAAVHIPLAAEVLPAVEISPLVDVTTRRAVYSYYEIEGQTSGRLKSRLLLGESGFVPHTMGDDPRYRPHGFGNAFVRCDYRAMELAVVQWLSGDPELAVACGGGDPYGRVYGMIARGASAGDKQRKMVKETLLPALYGAQAPALAKFFVGGEASAGSLLASYRRAFSVAFRFTADAQGEEYEDRFGRRRRFQRPWAARNFSVQAPAAAVCLERLVALHRSLPPAWRIAATVHDGYLLSVPDVETRDAAVVATHVLESPSDLAPGLRLTVHCESGPSLDALEPVRI